MSLIHCPECGKKISTSAPKCPQCGFPYGEYKEKAKSYGINVTSSNFISLYGVESYSYNDRDTLRYWNKVTDHKCPECGETLSSGTVCENCGFDVAAYKQMKAQKQIQETQNTIEKYRESAESIQQPQMIHCPGCQRELSVYAETCPHCAFPVQKFISEHNIHDIRKVFICPKCANTYCGINYEKKPIHLVCEFCGTPMIETEEDGAGVYYAKTHLSNSEFAEITRNIVIKYGDYDVDKKLFENRQSDIEYKERQAKMDRNKMAQEQKQSTAPNIPHCPVCGSTDIEKIGTLNRAVSTTMVGIASSKIGKQWHCKSCGNNF